LVLMAFPLFYGSPVQASALTYVRDTISNSAPGVSADHAIEFTVTTAVPALGEILITPASDFYIQNNFDHSHVDFSVGAEHLMVENGCGVTMSVEAGEMGKISFTTCHAIASGERITIKIFGIRNPLSSGSYRINIKTKDDQGNIIDESAAMIAVLESVSLNAKNSLLLPSNQMPGYAGGGAVASLSPISSPPPVIAYGPSTSATVSPSAPLFVTPMVVSSIREKVVVKFDYGFINTSTVPLRLKVVRRLLDSKGRVVKTVSAIKYVLVGKTFQVKVQENLPFGKYVEDIKIMAVSTGKIISQIKIQIAKDAPREKVLVLREIVSEDSPIFFDIQSLSELKRGVALRDYVKIKYGVFNKGKKPLKLKIDRQLIDEQKNKSVDSHWGQWVIGGNQKKSVTINQSFGKQPDIGLYLVRIRVYDLISGKLLFENGLRLEVREK